MEMLAVSLKCDGAYIARSLGFRGVALSSACLKLSPSERDVYNGFASFWRNLVTDLQRSYAHLSGLVERALSRSFEQLLLAFKAREIKRQTRRALRAGKSVVICLFSTGEQSTSRSIGGDGGAHSLVSTAREVAAHALTQIMDRAGPYDAELVAIAKAASSDLASLELPPGCLDHLINYFGPEHVAEMSGRHRRLLQRPAAAASAADGRPAFVFVPRVGGAKSNVDSVNVQERKAFQSGCKRIAIITDAGATGASLHADKRELNQQPRVHICAELGWSASRIVQSFGRTHRTNQVCPPEYVIVTTECVAEKRVAAAIAKRLESLGALTKGDRRAGSGEIGLFGISAGLSGLSNGEASVLASVLHTHERHNISPPAYLLGLAVAADDVRAWYDDVRARNPGFRFGHTMQGVSTVDEFLQAALTVPIESHESLMKLLISRKGTGSQFRLKQRNLALEKLSSASLRIVSRETLLRQPHVSALVVELDNSIAFGAVEAMRCAWLSRAGGELVAAFCFERATHRLALALRKDSTLELDLRPVRLIRPHDGCGGIISATVLNQRFGWIDSGAPGITAQLQLAWDRELCLARHARLHVSELSLLVGSIFHIWPRITDCIGSDPELKLVTTSDGAHVGGLLLPSAISPSDLGVALSLSSSTLELPTRRVWSHLPGITPWWLPKQLVAVPRNDVLSILNEALASKDHRIGRSVGKVEAGDIILGVMPHQVDAWKPLAPACHLFANPVNLKKCEMPGLPALVNAYSRFSSSFYNTHNLDDTRLEDHVAIASNACFLSLNALASNDASNKARSSHLRKLLLQVDRGKWMSERAASIRVQDSLEQPHPWLCEMCGQNNACRSEGAQCEGTVVEELDDASAAEVRDQPSAEDMMRDGPQTPKMVGCAKHFSYMDMAKRLARQEAQQASVGRHPRGVDFARASTVLLLVARRAGP